MDHQRISVVIAVRNGAETLQRALESIFGQTYEHLELIVMDGASSDGTVTILERYDADIAYWESAPDRGSTTPGIRHWNTRLATG